MDVPFGPCMAPEIRRTPRGSWSCLLYFILLLLFHATHFFYSRLMMCCRTFSHFPSPTKREVQCTDNLEGREYARPTGTFAILVWEKKLHRRTGIKETSTELHITSLWASTEKGSRLARPHCSLQVVGVGPHEHFG